MKQSILLLTVLITACQCNKNNDMLIGTKQPAQGITTAKVIIVLGQSNASGRAEVARLANTDYNYKGISTGYPSVRAGQAQYVTNPANVYTYWKGNSKTSANLAADNGSWTAYTAGSNGNGNANFDLATTGPTYNVFGSELSLATQLQESSGQEVYIIKCAVGGTSLTFNTTTTDPGTWNYTLRNVAAEFFIKRGMRDLRTFRPNTFFELAGVVWWQGEQDATDNVSAATYQSEFMGMKQVIDNAIKESFTIKKPYLWNMVKVSFNRNAAEGVINTALANVVAANSDCRLVNIDGYPRKMDLATDEASPVAVNYTSNSAGGADNEHSSYIAQLAAGELIFNNIQSTITQ